MTAIRWNGMILHLKTDGNLMRGSNKYTSKLLCSLEEGGPWNYIFVINNTKWACLFDLNMYPHFSGDYHPFVVIQ